MCYGNVRIVTHLVPVVMAHVCMSAIERYQLIRVWTRGVPPQILKWFRCYERNNTREENWSSPTRIQRNTAIGCGTYRNRQLPSCQIDASARTVR